MEVEKTENKTENKTGNNTGNNIENNAKLTEKIKKLSEKYRTEMIELREYLHRNPEIDLDLFNTQKTIKQKLDEIGIEYTEMAGTGICAIIRGEKGIKTKNGQDSQSQNNNENRKTILLRGDMDALPIQEEADVPFKSEIDGKMHACGHDGHTAGLFGALLIINELKGELDGNVKFAFQPGEEKSGGAEKMIKDGLLENPKVDMAFGIHLWGPMKEGKVSTLVGPTMASPDEFAITIYGKGGHASTPEITIDPVVIASHVVIGLQNIRSRMVSAFKPLVITCASIHTGDAFNVIPEKAVISGTVRTLDNELRDKAPELMRQVISGITSAYGATFELNYNKYYPILINDEKAVNIFKNASKKIFGETNYEDLKLPLMAAEDFAYFGYEVPSAFGFVGIAQDGKPEPLHHHPKFNFRSEIVLESAKLLAQSAFDAIEELKK